MIFGYAALIHRSQREEATQWCYENFGARWPNAAPWTGRGEAEKLGVWTCLWAGSDNFEYYNFHFHNIQDFTLFVLRWI